MDVDSTCPVPTEAYFLKRTKVPYRQVQLCSNTKLQGAKFNLAKSENSHRLVLKYFYFVNVSLIVQQLIESQTKACFETRGNLSKLPTVPTLDSVIASYCEGNCQTYTIAEDDAYKGCFL